ncbi:MAG TPA: hypothetical protein VK137_19520 [Planctomycetaceae bacterium]|nr:hypothetical protein [Planctomycetaceae bacterium]
MSRQVDFGLATEVYEDVTSRIGTLNLWGFSFAFDAQGNIYVAHASGRVTKYSPSGMQLQSFVMNFATTPAGFDAIDLGADQCTLFFTYALADGTGRIGRYNVCRDLALTDIPVVLAPFPHFNGERRGLRVLPDGSLLVTEWSSGRRIDTTGASLAVYTIPATVNRQWLAIALDPTGMEFWVGVDRSITQVESDLYRVNLISGNVTSGPLKVPATGAIRSVAATGEWRAATAAAVPIPTLSRWLIVTLGAFVVFIAIRRLA